MSEFFLKIVNMSISASWLLLAVLLLRLVLRKAPKWVSVLLWGFVAIRLICPFSIESMLSLIPSAETISPDIMMDWTPEVSTGIGSLDTVVNPIITETFAPKAYASANPLQILIPVCGNLWIWGILVMLVYTAVSYFLLRRKVATAVRLKSNIYQSENVDSPFVLGIIKPRIYLPFQMDGGNLEYVVAHEEAHIRRKDHWWKPFGFVLLALHWFNPLMWLGYILLCRDIELACDEKVIKGMDRESKADYAEALVACSVNRRSIAACPLAFGEVGVKERVKSVMNYRKPVFWIVVVAVVACVAVAVCFLTNPREDDRQDVPENGYFLLIGADGVRSIEISAGDTSGGVVNAEGSAFQKGEKVWLEPLQEVTDLRGFSITAFDENGAILYALSVPVGATNDEVINLVTGDGWLLAPTDFESKLPRIGGKMYIYENGGFMGSFTIRLYEDGSFTYYEGSASSYFGVGTWKQEEDTITLTDDAQAGCGLVNHFEFDGDDLVFVEKNSSNFIYVKVKNGEIFHCVDEAYKTNNEDDSGEKWDLVPMIRVNGTLYLDTGYNSAEEAQFGVVDGEITSQVDGSEMPVEDNQSNFGTGYEYQYGTIAGTIDLCLNGNWRIFATEEVRQQLQFSSQYSDVAGIDKAITEAILEHNGGERFVENADGLIKVESHCVLGVTPKSGTPVIGQTNHVVETTAYVQYVYHRYARSGGELDKVAGVGTPAAITFSYDPVSGYTMKEFWEPNSGSAYAEDIRSKFPGEIADMILDPQNKTVDVGALEAKCLEKAQKIDTDELLAKCLENVQEYVADLVSQWG